MSTAHEQHEDYLLAWTPLTILTRQRDVIEKKLNDIDARLVHAKRRVEALEAERVVYLTSADYNANAIRALEREEEDA